ncbi:MAG: nucleotidyltransferase [Fibrobacter sp.]|nr:nucleotidyltransferase [Fibrobacter sp.]
MIKYGKFRDLLKLVEEQHHRLQALAKQADTELWVLQAVKESAVQRFETCWDCLWKVLKRYLNEELNLPEVPNAPNPILRLAGGALILPSSVGQWLKYALTRIDTSHDYSGEKADIALAILDDFVKDAVALYEKMTQERWQSDL